MVLFGKFLLYDIEDSTDEGPKRNYKYMTSKNVRNYKEMLNYLHSFVLEMEQIYAAQRES